MSERSHMQNFEVVEQLLASRFGGTIYRGSHDPNGHACLLEVAHAAVGDAWSDAPDKWPDLRTLNDAFTDDVARTQQLIPVLRAYWDWSAWGAARQRAVMGRVAILTVQRLVAELPGLPADFAQPCRDVTTLRAASWAASEAAMAVSLSASEANWADSAARAVSLAAMAAVSLAASEAARAASLADSEASLAARAASWAASLADRAASLAARAASLAARAASAASEAAVLRTACALWIEAAKEEAMP